MKGALTCPNHPWHSTLLKQYKKHDLAPIHRRSRLAALVAADGYVHPSGRLFWGGVKEFADGSLGSCTALMHQPYASCAPGHANDTQHSDGSQGDSDSGCEGSDGAAGRCGIRLIEPEQLEQLVMAADRAGLQVWRWEKQVTARG